MSPPFGRRDPPQRYDPDHPPPTNPRRVLDALGRHRVEYLIVGGVAVQAHGHNRTTGDVDVVVERSRANLERLAAALDELSAELGGVDAHLLGIDPTDPSQLYDGANFTLYSEAGPLDVWTDWRELPGARQWEEMRGRAVPVETRGIQFHVVSFDDLIALKREASRLPNRPEAKRAQDRDDIAALTAHREQLRREARRMNKGTRDRGHGHESPEGE